MSHAMALKNKLYQKRFLKAISTLDYKKNSLQPLVIELDPTSVCDLACPGCINEDLVNKSNSFSNERLIELGNEFILGGVKAVVLIGGGEPLAHPNIGAFMKLLGENDVHIGITTNGTFINKYLDEISEFSKWTRVSVDAATDSMFKKLRPSLGNKSKFNLVINNMKMLAKNKKGTLGYSFLIQSEADGNGVVSNVSEIFDAAKLSKDIGCDYFEVKPSYQWRKGVVHSLVKHDSDLMIRAREVIDSLEELEDGDFKIIKAINLEASLSGVDKTQHKSYKYCPSTFVRTTVTPSGVFLCPYWRGKDNMKLGDVRDLSFSELWNSPSKKKLMEKFDTSVDCASIHCLRHETNLTIYEIQKKLKSGIAIDSIEEYDRFI